MSVRRCRCSSPVPVEHADGHHAFCEKCGERLPDPRDRILATLARRSADHERKIARLEAQLAARTNGHLSRAERRELIAEALRASPEQSNRSLARRCGVDHKTVGAVRAELERRGEIPGEFPTKGAVTR